MTIRQVKKALRQIKESISWADKYPFLYRHCVDCVPVFALKAAQEVLEKQIPKKAVIIDDDLGISNGLKRCPVCEQIAVGDYCWNCGQKLNWGDDK